LLIAVGAAFGKNSFKKIKTSLNTAYATCVAPSRNLGRYAFTTSSDVNKTLPKPALTSKAVTDSSLSNVSIIIAKLRALDN